MESRFRPGTIVSARGREWIVLAPREPEVLRLRPLTTAQGEEVGLFLPLEGERVRPARFADPEPVAGGDSTGIMTLFDAARLSLRSGAGPFRSLGRISVVPRPYQFVPLIMSLRQSPVRLLIADDVGVSKTIEAAMIARELLDRGLARRLAVLCPAHLCDQWERALREKFAIETVLVQPSQMRRLERGLPRPDISVYQHYANLVASIDFVKSSSKSSSQRDRFLAAAPDLVIVDEAHAAARPRGTASHAEHQRYELLRDLARDPNRHILLVTATPHSGIEESFRSLLGLLDRSFDRDPAEPLDREALVPCLVQRRRRDVEKWLGSETPFPERRAEEARYELSRANQSLFADVLDYCRESLEDARGLRAPQQRVRHWAAIAILRSLLSSPDAAAMVLGNRAAKLGDDRLKDGETSAEVDDTYRPQVLDLFADEEAADYAPTGPVDQAERIGIDYDRRRLQRFGERARALAGPKEDWKLRELVEIIRRLLRDDCRPIVFCRFIPTAEYVAAQLSKLIGREFAGLHVEAVTGDIGDDERKEKIDELSTSARRILVATDCLSEGIDLQEHFDAVVHYDLPWNPNRLEQREGRVDRFGQPKRKVRTVLLYGTNNQVDQVVLEVLIRKATTIRESLGIAVPVPLDPEQVMETVVDNVLLARVPSEQQLELALSTPMSAACMPPGTRRRSARSANAASLRNAASNPTRWRKRSKPLTVCSAIRTRFTGSSPTRCSVSAGGLRPDGRTASSNWRQATCGHGSRRRSATNFQYGSLLPQCAIQRRCSAAPTPQSLRCARQCWGKPSALLPTRCLHAPERCAPTPFGSEQRWSSCACVTRSRKRSRNSPRRSCSPPLSEEMAVCTGSSRSKRPVARSLRQLAQPTTLAQKRKRSRSAGRSDS
jgi:superfamily II DNA or RNA helicase